MNWNYHCPECSQPTDVKWEWLEREVLCPHCGATHYPPTPHEDHYAFVDTDTWPSEIEEAVTALRGTVCAVPGCYRERKTLVHRKPIKLGGKTTVDNLMPMCEQHAQSKGDREYDEWLAEIRQQEKAKEPQIEITITTKRPEARPVSDGYSFGAPSGFHTCITSGQVTRTPLKETATPVVNKLFAVPFLRGPATKLVIDYDWQAAQSGLCKVFLLAWPRGDMPNIAALGSPTYDGPFAMKEHLAVAGEKGSNQLDLVLPEAPGGRWTVAVAVIDAGADLNITEYAIAGTN